METLPWITKSIKVQMKQRKSLYDKAKWTQAASDWRAYIVRVLSLLKKAFLYSFG